ncbi:uncharacterized protein N7459_009638 [Penicillium hispanicum]|uniref:uncharacterized protein n=1 Tax=Penicillium hispanicum TaxID=1080232 RepID=UPI00253F84CF|nr:uncharacterized protein N7459_009638 [Penicillium hispanicum]KAJ5570208.1 hypothetical protein N7459_009638 [Penicillium hispanicum]
MAPSAGDLEPKKADDPRGGHPRPQSSALPLEPHNSPRPRRSVRLRKFLYADDVKILVDVDAVAPTLRRANVQLKARFRKAATAMYA